MKTNMDINEHEILSKFTQSKVKEHRFYCCSTFHSHSSTILSYGLAGHDFCGLLVQMYVQNGLPGHFATWSFFTLHRHMGIWTNGLISTNKMGIN